MATKLIKIDEGGGNTSTFNPDTGKSTVTTKTKSASPTQPSTSPVVRGLGETDRAAEKVRQSRSSAVVQKESTKPSATGDKNSSRPSVAINTSVADILGQAGSNVNRTYKFGSRQFYRLKDGRIYEWKDGGLRKLTDKEKDNNQRILKTQDDVKLFGSVEAAVAGRSGQSDDSFLSKMDSIQQRLKDNVVEGLSFGKADTNTFNRPDLSKRYTVWRDEVGIRYDEMKSEIEGSGRELTETKQQYLTRVMPQREQYIKGILDAAPLAKTLIKEVGLASIPLYGTARTWEDSPNWARALGVASDVALFVPIVGQIAAGSRAGQGIARTLAQAALAEMTGPVRAIANPFNVARSAGRTVRTLKETLDPKALPLSAVEAQFSSIKIPTKITSERRLKAAIPTDVAVDDQILRGIEPSDGMKARDELTTKAIFGKKAVADIGDSGLRARIAQSPIQRVRAGAISATPDIRNGMAGLIVTAGKDVSITGEKLGLFAAPSFSKRFALKANNERALSEAAQKLVDLGKLSDEKMPGMYFYTDPALVAKFKSSNKLYQGATEIETTLPPGTVIPPPSQLLFTRDPITGQKFTIAIVGKPLSKAERARIKVLGTQKAFQDMFSSPGSVSRVADKAYKDAGIAGAEAQALLIKASKTDDVREAIALREQAVATIRRGEESIGKMARVTNAPRVSEGALYTGKQDIRGAFERMGQVDSINTRTGRTIKSTGSSSNLRGDATKPGDTKRVVGSIGDVRSTGKSNGRGESENPRGGDKPSGRSRAVVDDPRSKPGDKGKPVARVRGLKKSKARIGINGEVIDRKGKKVAPDAVVAWKQGFGWWVVTPSYITPRDAFFTRKRPVGVRFAQGPKSAFKTIVALGGRVPRDFQLDLGIVEAKVTGGRTPGLGFGRKKS